MSQVWLNNSIAKRDGAGLGKDGDMSSPAFPSFMWAALQEVFDKKRQVEKKMRKKKIYIMAVAMAVLTVLGAGCGNADRPDGDKGENGEISTRSSEAEPSPVPAEEGTKEAESMEGNDPEDPLSAYYDVLDMFYYKTLNGWERTEDVSYMFYWDYTYVHSLSDAGYMLTDMNGDGVPELLVSTVTDAADGLIYDLYTCVDGKAVHAASSGERFRYSLNEENAIFYWASSGASNSTFAACNIDADDGSVRMEEVVRYDASHDKENPWFYGTEGCYDKTNGFDFSHMESISEEDARRITDGYKAAPLELTLFSSYSPHGEMPASDSLRIIFRSAIGSEAELDFVCADFDGDGAEEAFGITGEDDGLDIHDLKLYFIPPDGQASCIGTLDILFGYGGMQPSRVMDTGSARFLSFGGADGQETWLYGVRDGEAYQPEVSGKHAEFRMTEDGRFFAQPHEGGEGYYMTFFEFDPATGEFIEKKDEP
ncbi:MAG: hypothetical protein NC307_12190 [Roseburia sp.]|nr:hypothetical protein [Roseburia sp.]